MKIECVKNPDQVYRSRVSTGEIGEIRRSRYRLNDSWDRFNSRFRIGYGGAIQALSRYQGFKGYDLGSHDLLGIRSYERSGEIARIVKERIGEPYLLGIELEIERVKDRGIVGDILKRYLPDRHICVRDGSIASDGIEIVTSPIAPREIGRIPWYNLLRSLSRSGCTSHDSGACGLHVSISRGYLRDRTWRSIRSMLSRDRALFESLSRRTIGKGNRGDPFSFCSFNPSESKYQALNLSKGSVCEFRFFRGTLSPGSFIASIEIVRSIVEYAKDREHRSGDRAPRITAKGWIEWVRNRGSFGVACEYMREHADRYLTIPKAPRGSSRRVACFIRDRARGNGFEINASGDLVLEGPTGDRLIHSLTHGPLCLGSTLREYRIPILWDRCHDLPAYVRDLVYRGKAPREIVVRSPWILDNYGEPLQGRGIGMSFYRGGWGSRSQLHIHGIKIQG